ncbi:hypothetical protein SAMN05421507_103414 [Lentzea jiangxiensis]|uniref:Uncharacterized protein n=1 Tax=Lentzea jiangxiensis TaxID=641025 RepID=A0A1H0LRT0_9PSEU|nr:hypothetical protein SAMN05421507_103414 [Lentzea jiangxiensis]
MRPYGVRTTTVGAPRSSAGAQWFAGHVWPSWVGIRRSRARQTAEGSFNSRCASRPTAVPARSKRGRVPTPSFLLGRKTNGEDT